MTVAECLRRFQTGGIRRQPNGLPFEDVIDSGRTPEAEREIAAHPSLKPQDFLRKLAHAALPLGTGIIADTFMGAGSTIAASEALGYQSVGIERAPQFFKLACQAVKPLALI
jgi:site-specific DNA-methyltransferase (adenine-specific)